MCPNSGSLHPGKASWFLSQLCSLPEGYQFGCALTEQGWQAQPCHQWRNSTRLHRGWGKSQASSLNRGSLTLRKKRGALSITTSLCNDKCCTHSKGVPPYLWGNALPDTHLAGSFCANSGAMLSLSMFSLGSTIFFFSVMVLDWIQHVSSTQQPSMFPETHLCF